MRSQWKMLSAGLLFAALVLIAASWYVYQKEAQFTSSLRAQLDSKKVALTMLAKESSQDTLDPALSRILTNCNTDDQAQFDMLLGNLGQLKSADLKKVQQLFDTCALIYPEQKQLMALRINDEFLQYTYLAELLRVTQKKTVLTEYPTEAWKKFTDMETKRGLLGRQLVDLQGTIIKLLLSGKSVSSPDVQQQVADAQHTRDTLSLLLTQEKDLLKNELGLGI